jgi:hypothetical protein
VTSAVPCYTTWRAPVPVHVRPVDWSAGRAETDSPLYSHASAGRAWLKLGCPRPGAALLERRGPMLTDVSQGLCGPDTVGAADGVAAGLTPSVGCVMSIRSGPKAEPVPQAVNGLSAD